MVLTIHIIIALASIAFTTLLFARPSRAKFYTNYSLISATLISGTYLVVTSNTSILKACLSGLAYVSVVSLMTLVARQKLLRTQAAMR